MAGARSQRLAGTTTATTTLTTVYTVPTGKTALVKSIWACNVDTAARAFVVVIGSPATVAYVLVKTLAANEHVIVLPELALNAGDFLQVQATVNAKIGYVISGAVLNA